jgi:hypothetical protein
MCAQENTTQRGWVYIIANDSYVGSRLKIGKTDRDPIDRARELVSTGTTGTFVVIYHALVDNPYGVEQQVHQRLWSFNVGGEWFEVCPDLAVQEIRTVAGARLHAEDTTPRWHGSQAAPREETKELLKEARERAEAQRAERARLQAEAERQRLQQEAEAVAERTRLEAEAARLQREREAEAERQRRQREREEAEARERERLENERAQRLEAERLQRLREERERWARVAMEQSWLILRLAAPVLVVLLGLRLVDGVWRQKHQSVEKNAKRDRGNGEIRTEQGKNVQQDASKNIPVEIGGQATEAPLQDNESRLESELAVASSHVESGNPAAAIKVLWPSCNPDAAERLYGKGLRAWRRMLVLSAECSSALWKRFAVAGDVGRTLYWRLQEGRFTHVLAREHLACGESTEAWSDFDKATDLYDKVATQGLRKVEEGGDEEIVVKAAVHAIHLNAEIHVQFAEAIRLPEPPGASTSAESLRRQAQELANRCLAIREKHLPEDAEGRDAILEIARRAGALSQ